MAISIRIKKGKYQVVDVTYDKKGISTINEISEWLSIPKSVQNMTSIPSNKDLVIGTKYAKYFTK
jgi:hypothetical protein